MCSYARVTILPSSASYPLLNAEQFVARSVKSAPNIDSEIVRFHVLDPSILVLSRFDFDKRVFRILIGL